MEKTSRFNYIKRGLVGVCAATMLTGLCAGAAFGAVAPEGPTGTSPVDADNSATTTVNAEVDAQLSVTVPASFKAAVGSDGVLQFPNNVTLSNTSALSAVHVSDISATAGISPAVVLKSNGDFASASEANAVWSKVKAGAAEFDLGGAAAFSSAAAWNIPASGNLAVSFEGAIKNPSATGSIKLYDIKWTVAYGAQA